MQEFNILSGLAACGFSQNDVVGVQALVGDYLEVVEWQENQVESGRRLNDT